LERVHLRQTAAHAHPSSAGGGKPVLHSFLLRTEEEQRLSKRSSHGVLSSGYETSKKREPVPSKEREFVSI
jgi:hypothetical protein